MNVIFKLMSRTSTKPNERQQGLKKVTTRRLLSWLPQCDFMETRTTKDYAWYDMTRRIYGKNDFHPQSFAFYVMRNCREHFSMFLFRKNSLRDLLPKLWNNIFWYLAICCSLHAMKKSLKMLFFNLQLKNFSPLSKHENLRGPLEDWLSNRGWILIFGNFERLFGWHGNTRDKIILMLIYN